VAVIIVRLRTRVDASAQVPFLSWEYFVHISPLFSRGAVAGGPPTLLTDQG